MEDIKVLTEEATEIVWLPKSLAIKIKELKDGESQSKLIVEYIESMKRELKINIESMDEDVLIFRGLMAKAKQAFKETKETELNSFYELWEKFETDKKKVREFVIAAKAELQPLKLELKEIGNLMDGIDKWKIDNLLETIKKVGEYAYEGSETHKILKFLFDNYKRAEKE